MSPSWPAILVLEVLVSLMLALATRSPLVTLLTVVIVTALLGFARLLAWMITGGLGFLADPKVQTRAEQIARVVNSADQGR